MGLLYNSKLVNSLEELHMDIMKHCSSSTGLHINTTNQFKLNISRTT